MPTKKKTSKSKGPLTDGLFITRRMRREADAAAKAEADAAALSADDVADDMDRAAIESTPEWQAKSAAERTFDAERAQARATADARKKYGLY